MHAVFVAMLALTPSAAPDIAIERRHVYAYADGMPLRMTLYRPAGVPEAARPAIVLLHGGAWTLGFRGLKDWYGRQLARDGFVAVSIGYRKMPKHRFPACLEDAKAAVRWLRLHKETYNVDTDRIAAMGDSAGGHLALMLAVTVPSDGFEGESNPGVSSAVQAAVSLYGVSDLTYYRRPDNLMRRTGLAPRFMREFAGERAGDGPDPLAQASPANYVRPGIPPVLLVHGRGDSIVPFTQSEEFVRRAQEAGVNARLLAVDGRGHSFDYVHPGARRALYVDVRAFLFEVFGHTSTRTYAARR